MEEKLFDAIHEHAQKHWWFRGRRVNLFSLLDRLYARDDGQVLDLGCGPGNNLQSLSRYGTVWGADPSEHALAYCRQSFDGRLDKVFMPDDLPYEDETFDLIVMMDVLEHIEKDVSSLQRLIRLLKPGGTLALTVPALMWLWSYHDVEHHHFRRYHKGPLRRLLSDAGFEVQKLSYMNSFLLPVMGLVRILFKPKTWTSQDLEGGTRGLSKILEWIFSSERFVLRFASFPLGGSLVAVCRRPLDLTLDPWHPDMALPDDQGQSAAGA